jgi:hypothetical protein
VVKKMKKQIGILLAAILILLLGWNLLSAPAVRETDPPEEDIAGSDWRTWGIIDDQGTLVRGGEAIDFCACVHTGDTALYYDTEDQVLLAELVYPAPVENAEERYLGMEITDRNGDGSSDILLRFSQGKGTLELLFCWDPETENFLSVPS